MVWIMDLHTIYSKDFAFRLIGDETTTSHKPENATREELGNSLKVSLISNLEFSDKSLYI